ncbi:MAG: fumarylacetoacetate hydrolase family protein, partial [Pseudomonadota bacterium]
VNGTVRQDADLADMIWPVAEHVSKLSFSMALEPGDLIMTGTPAGVAALEVGDAVTAEVAGIGTLSITIGPAKSDD